MSQKRQQREEGTSFDDRRPKKSPSFKSVVMEVMNLCKLQNLMEPVLEPLVRRIVKEEVDSALRKYIIRMKRHCGEDRHPPEPMSLQLQFINAISLPVFTGACIEGEGGNSMEIALIDSLSGQVVSDGLGSYAKVEVLVLEGDFDSDEKENWTFEEFRNNTVREREGKKPLLSGDVIVTLKDGMGMVGNVVFTDNSSWTRSRKFRLGARVLDDIGDVRVREARSEPFIVRDHRGELYKKHYPPSLCDEVWRLEKIGKDGAFHKRLRKERINTVQDFLMLLFLDPTRLRNANARELVMTAFADREKIVTFEGEPSPVVPTPSSLSVPQSSNLQSDIIRSDYLQQNAPTPDYMQSVFEDCLQGIVDPVGVRSDRPLSYFGQVSDGLICDTDSMSGGFLSNEHLRYFEADCTLENDTQSDLNAFMSYSSVPDYNDPKKGWNVLVSVIRWWCSIKRIVARKSLDGNMPRYCR